MKKNLSLKNILILSLIFLFVLSIGSSFATEDLNTTGDNNLIDDNAMADTLSDEKEISYQKPLMSDENSNSNNGSDEEKVISSNSSKSESFLIIRPNESSITVLGGNFQDLQDAIDYASDNYTIYLICNMLGEGKPIIVNKSVVIEGNGHTLDANYSSRIFCILSDNVVLKNLELIHGYQRAYDSYKLRPYDSKNFDNAPALTQEFFDYSVPPLNSTDDIEYGWGPAIKWLGNNGTLIDSAILNNKIDYANDIGEGKAVSWLGTGGRIINTFMVSNEYHHFFVPWGIVGYQQKSEGKVLDTSPHGVYYGNIEGNVYFLDVALNVLPNLDVKNVTSYYGEGKKISFNLNHGNASFVNESLELSILSKKYNYTFNVFSDENGNVEFNLPKNLSVGSYNLIVGFNDGKNNISSNTTVKINKATVSVSAPDFKAQYYSGAKYTLKLINAKTKKPISGMKVNLNVYNGKKVKTYTVKTNNKGIATFDKFTLPSVIYDAGKHKVTISVDKSYDLSKKEFTVQISKAKTDIKLLKTSFKYKKSDNLKISIKNQIKKTAISGLKLKVKVYTGKKYKTYTLKTDKNGMVKINTKILSKGSHKIQITSEDKRYLVSKTTSIKVA